MQAKPKVSVVIPTYNYAHFLDETVQSVLDQTYTDFELIIVDNCSTDNTAEVVQKYLTDKRVNYIVNEQNLGLVGNWNKCLELAQGEYVKFLCADDKFHPQLLEKFVPVMDQHPNVAIVAAYNQLFGGMDTLRKQPYTGLVNGRFAWETLVKEGARNWLNNPSAVMFRKTACVAAGRFNPKLLNMTDKEYYARLLYIGDCYVIPEVLAYIRSHPDTVSFTSSKQPIENTLETYWFFLGIKASSGPNPEIDAIIKRRAVRCARLMYHMLPGLHKKNKRKAFKKAFRIGYTEGVLFNPLFKFLQQKLVVGK